MVVSRYLSAREHTLSCKGLSVTIAVRTIRLYPNLIVESILPPMLLLKNIFECVSPMSDTADLSRRLG